MNIFIYTSSYLLSFIALIQLWICVCENVVFESGSTNWLAGTVFLAFWYFLCFEWYANQFGYTIKQKQNKTNKQKKKWYILDLCVSSLRRGHANLLCIVPILADDPRGVPNICDSNGYKGALRGHLKSYGSSKRARLY